MNVKLITNIGYWKGLDGNGLICLGKAENGNFAALNKQLIGGVEKWVYLRKSMIENGMSGQDILIASDFNLSLLTDVVSPEFVTASDDYFKIVPAVTGGDAVPRMYTLQSPYSIKGADVFSSDIDAIKTGGTVTPTTGGTVTTGTGTVPATSGGTAAFLPTDFSELLNNPVKFIQDYPVFTLAVAAVVIYFVRRKKKKPLFIF